jgi:hypothetical protein
MMLGCGYCVKRVRGRPYLYFWHYEDRGGRRDQVEEYVGPAQDPRSRDAVARKVEAYAKRARSELVRVVRAARVEMAVRA